MTITFDENFSQPNKEQLKKIKELIQLSEDTELTEEEVSEPLIDESPSA